MGQATAAAASARWVPVLDELEQRIAVQEEIVDLAGRGLAPEPDELLALIEFAAPEGLPPMPAALAERAGRLLDRTRAVQARVAELVETTRPARGPRRPRATRWRASTNLDVRA